MAKAKSAKTSKTRSAKAGPPATATGNERERFEEFLTKFSFKWECVFDRKGNVIAEEDPDDPGGVTKYGIDKSAHPNLSANQIRNLTEDEAVELYFNDEWPRSHGGELPVPLGEISFDMTILDGAGRAMRALQSACGLTGADVDGGWGPTTLAAASATAQDNARLMRAADRMLDLRAARYHNLVEENPKLTKFLRGWLNRTDALREYLKVPDVA